MNQIQFSATSKNGKQGCFIIYPQPNKIITTLQEK
jgi:hypothetical protein